jgi:hypothetical protein
MKSISAILATLLALPVLAQGPADAIPQPDTHWEQLRAQSTELRGRAKLMRTQADKTHTDATALCREKFLMASCLDDAKKARQEAERAIQRVEREAAEIDRRLRIHDHEVRLEQRAQKDRERALEAAQRAEEIRQEDEKHRLKNEKRAAEEEQRRQKARQD